MPRRPFLVQCSRHHVLWGLGIAGGRGDTRAKKAAQMVILFSELMHDVQDDLAISSVVSQRTIVATLLRLEKGHPQQEHRRSTRFVELLVQLFSNCVCCLIQPRPTESATS